MNTKYLFITSKIRALLVSATLVTAVLLLFVNQVTFAAISADERRLINIQSRYHSYTQGQLCTTTGSSVTPGQTTGTNADHAGKSILSDAQFTAIKENQSFYEAAAQEADIPWQMIAVIHLRETGLKRINPSNGQGIYQFVSGHGGPYPAGAVDDAEFARQTKLVAEFIKGKANANVEQNRSLTTSATPEAIKDTFFSYNGRSSKYAEQAAGLGFSSESQPYEGSPYVMNRADAKRDPATAPAGTWGQVKRDFGPIEYPANNDYGAFVVYGALAGISTTGNCSDAANGTVRQKVVAIAKQELELWKSGELKPSGNDYHKYTGGASGNWCAWFSSWVYNQAGYPLDSNTPEGRVSLVDNIKIIGEKREKFVYHPVGSYTPQPGDLVIQKEGVSHVNIVIAVDGNKLTIIGGNQGYGQGANHFSNSSVTQYILDINDSVNTGFVSPKAEN